jgi:HlyD family secretion protein
MVKRSSITEMLPLDGVVAAQDQTSVTYGFRAIVDVVHVKAGQVVKQGEPLIDFSTGDLPKTLDDARARLLASQVTLAQAQARQQTAAQKAVADQAQRAQAVLDAEAGLKAAQDNLTMVRAGKSLSDRQAQETAVSYGNAQLQQAQDDLDRLLAGPDAATLRAAQAEEGKNQAALAKAQADLAALTRGPDAATVRAAENLLQRVQTQLKIAQATKPDPKLDPAIAGLQHDAAVQDAQLAEQNAQVALAKLKEPPSDQDVKTARQRVQDAQDAVNAAQAKVDGLQVPDSAAVNAAQTNIEHIKHYLAEATANLNEVLSHPTPAEMASAQDQIRKAQAAVDNARRAADAPSGDDGADMKTLQTAVTQNESEVTRLQQALENTRVKAPHDGTVVAVRIKVGDTVTPGKALALLAKPGAPIVRVDLADADAARVAVGQHATVQIDTANGALSSIDATMAAVTPAAADGSSSASAALQVNWPNGQSPRFGLPAQVSVTVGQKDGVLVVPTTAVHKSANRNTVEVQDGTLRRLVSVQVGITNVNVVEILSGLDEGQLVLATPSS